MEEEQRLESEVGDSLTPRAAETFPLALLSVTERYKYGLLPQAPLSSSSN